MQIPYICALLIAIVLIGCAKEIDIKPDTADENMATLIIQTKTLDITSEIAAAERIVKKLRLMVFDEYGVQVFNRLYIDPETISQNEGNIYSIRERLPKTLGNIRICLVANEFSSWNLGRTTNKVTYTMLQNKVLNFERDCPDLFSGNNMDINIGDGNCLMFSDAGAYYFGENGVQIATPVELVRTLAKISLTLSYDQNNFAGINFTGGERFELIKASVHHQPVESYLTPAVYNYDNFISSTAKPFSYDSNNITPTTNTLTFYIPEHLISTENMILGQYTLLQVWGRYVKSNGLPLDVSYHIPIGNGVQKLYDGKGLFIKDLNTADLTITRNTHYVFTGTINKLGELDGLQLYLQVKDWEDGGYIDVEHPAPWLNVSDIVVTAPAQIYFWSNTPNISVVSDYCKKLINGNKEDIAGGVSVILNKLVGTDKTNLELLSSGDGSIYTPYNGFLKLEPIISDQIDEGINTFFIQLNANGLKREIKVIIKK